MTMRTVKLRRFLGTATAAPASLYPIPSLLTMCSVER